MIGARLRLGASVLVVTLAASSLWAGHREVKTVESAANVVQGLSVIPWGLLHNAAGVAIIPHALKAALVVDGEFGRGVILIHEPDGRWSNPIFITLHGGGIGGQAGIESTDLVLVFRTRKALDRALQGKCSLGQEVSIAAGPIGREAELATEGPFLKAEIFSYSRSRGLFTGVSLERTRLHIDAHSNRAFYGLRAGDAREVLARRGNPIAAAEMLKARLIGLKGPPNVQPVPVRPLPWYPIP
ncbi:MAG TPA: lipid-binding SYLF domain-containing protein [Gemmataceae bacterium]|nr:lipid-binding SYLF domain-containing protein [Gemmataceae bacterium]